MSAEETCVAAAAAAALCAVGREGGCAGVGRGVDGLVAPSPILQD